MYRLVTFVIVAYLALILDTLLNIIPGPLALLGICGIGVTYTVVSIRRRR